MNGTAPECNFKTYGTRYNSSHIVHWYKRQFPLNTIEMLHSHKQNTGIAALLCEHSHANKQDYSHLKHKCQKVCKRKKQ